MPAGADQLLSHSALHNSPHPLQAASDPLRSRVPLARLTRRFRSLSGRGPLCNSASHQQRVGFALDLPGGPQPRRRRLSAAAARGAMASGAENVLLQYVMPIIGVILAIGVVASPTRTVWRTRKKTDIGGKA